MDDLKISHVIPKVVTRVIKWLDCKYPGVTSTRGKKHQYLGMEFDFSTKGEVNISMVPYVEQVIEDFMEPITTSSATPVTEICLKCARTVRRKFFLRNRRLHFIILLPSYYLR